MWKTGWTCLANWILQGLFTNDAYSDRQYPYFNWIWNFFTSFPEVLQFILSCYRCIQPLTSHFLAYMYTFQLFWSLLFFRLKILLVSHLTLSSYLACPTYLCLFTILMQGTKYRFWISSFPSFLFPGLYIEVFTWTLCPQTHSGSETARTETSLPDSQVEPRNVPQTAFHLPAFFP